MFERTVIKDEVQSFFKGMPKASLHIHIEGMKTVIHICDCHLLRSFFDLLRII